MSDGIRIVYDGGTGELIQKKSRFIADVIPIESEEEAYAFLEKKKKEYWDARHHCYAFVLGDRREIMRFSDDGEPGGTAGRPMLDVLVGEDLHNVCVVVTRYFGGVLLGTGGLVRAYSGAVKEGLANSVITTRCEGIPVVISTDYTGIGKIQYIVGSRGLHTLESSYTDRVEITILVPVSEKDSFLKAVTEGTNGKAVLTEQPPCSYLVVDNEVLIV